jgi:hypothetical protein
MSFDGPLLNASHCRYNLIFAYLCLYIILNMAFIVNIHLIKVIATSKGVKTALLGLIRTVYGCFSESFSETPAKSLGNSAMQSKWG